MKCNPKHKTYIKFINKKLLRVVGFSSAFCFGIRSVFVVLILLACGDSGLNSGLKKGAPATISQFAFGI